MMKLAPKIASLLAVATMISVPVSPAMACHRDYDRGYDYDQGREYGTRGYDRGYYEQRNYDQRSRYYRNSRCDRGTGGLIIGAIAGGLLGHEVVGRRGDRTAGTIVGAGVGALAGRAIDRSDSRRC